MGRMTDEQISALLDGELSEDQEALLYRRLDTDPALRETFGRFSLISDLLIDADMAPEALQLADRVRKVLHVEEGVVPPAAPRVRDATGWLGVGLAAAAAVLVAVGLDPIGRDGQVSERVAASVIDPVAMAHGAASPELPRASVSDDRMARYLVTHAAYANPVSRQFVESHLVMPAFRQAAWVAEGSNQ